MVQAREYGVVQSAECLLGSSGVIDVPGEAHDVL